MRDWRIEHRAYIAEHGDDMPEIHDWTWGAGNASGAREVQTRSV